MGITTKDIYGFAVVLVLLVWLIGLASTASEPVFTVLEGGVETDHLVWQWNILAFFADEGYIRKLAPMAAGFFGLWIGNALVRHRYSWRAGVIDLMCVACFLICIYVLYRVWNPSADVPKTIREIVTGDGEALTSNLRWVLGGLALWIGGFVYANAPSREESGDADNGVGK
ncbi:MAG: hypothetical protein AAFY51_09580 [Pseudomonadota bacterium]